MVGVAARSPAKSIPIEGICWSLVVNVFTATAPPTSCQLAS